MEGGGRSGSNMGQQNHHSNFDRFLECTTPKVRSTCLDKSSVPNWNPKLISLGEETTECFKLGDLWNSYEKWSAYGVGIKVSSGGRDVLQYYTPSLSAIQIYTASSMSSDARSDSPRKYATWCSNEGVMLPRSVTSVIHDKGKDVKNTDTGVGGLCVQKSKPSELYLEFIEKEEPYKRVPLKDKIDQLSKQYPGLKSFSSMDISPSSWLAVAWYPIYQIPTLTIKKEMRACFLTYHCLSTIPQDSAAFGTSLTKAGHDIKHKEKIRVVYLPPFGLASYRMQSDFWLNPYTNDHYKMYSLINNARIWLNQLKVHHHDFNFFMSRTH